MPLITFDSDPEGLLEYSVVYTDRSLNHMSVRFRKVMNDISAVLKQAYHAATVVIVPGSGTFAMEAVARQLARKKKCLIIRNGLFSYRWTRIFEMGDIPSGSIVLKAIPADDTAQPAFAPPPVDQVTDTISKEKPDLVFAPHVETSSGIILPDDYIARVSAAVHAAGGLFILDCVASGTIWVDMKESGVDVIISAPQKGWSGTPCCGFVMLNEQARKRVETTVSDSFACDLLRWHQIMQAYENGGHAYHATMPTDALAKVRDVLQETGQFGFETARKRQQDLGGRVRKLLAGKGFKSVAADGYQAPGVVVCYTHDQELQNGRKFAEAGLQVAPGVPLQVDEPKDFMTFRIGLFGLDKLQHVDRTVTLLEDALNRIALT